MLGITTGFIAKFAIQTAASYLLCDLGWRSGREVLGYNAPSAAETGEFLKQARTARTATPKKANARTQAAPKSVVKKKPAAKR